MSHHERLLEELRGRFVEGAKRWPGLSCLLVHFGPGTKPPSILSLVKHRIPLGDAVLCGADEFRNWDFSASRFAVRQVYFANEPAALREYLVVATDAAGVLADGHVRSAAPTLTTLRPAQLWVQTVFELAWQGHTGLRATKKLWDARGIMYPRDTDVLRAAVKCGAEHLEAWAQELPDWWASELPDMFVASARAADILMRTAPRPAAKGKRSTERGEAQLKLIAALTRHHRYADGGCLNLEPIGCNELARMAGVSNKSASAFFRKEFGGYGKYRARCQDAAALAASLKLLNGEFSPSILSGATPSHGEERHAD